jgi:uncharacterized protein YbjT (DUF2867 family)
MSHLPTAVVFGTTGQQGGAVARSLLASQRWNVRAVTRHPEGSAAHRIRLAGAEVVGGDLDDPEVGAKVLGGADALFVVTNPWEPQRDDEYVQGKRVIDSAVAAGIDNIVLPGVNEISLGELSVTHCDNKYALECQLRGEGAPVAFVQPGWYFQNWYRLPLLQLSRDEDGVATFTNSVGDGYIPAVDINDLGPVVAALMDDPVRYRGVSVPVTSELRTSDDFAATFTAKLGEPVRYQPIARDALLASGPESRQLADMFEFFRRYARDVSGDEQARAIHPAMSSLAAWLDSEIDTFRTLLATPVDGSS